MVEFAAKGLMQSFVSDGLRSSVDDSLARKFTVCRQFLWGRNSGVHGLPSVPVVLVAEFNSSVRLASGAATFSPWGTGIGSPETRQCLCSAILYTIHSPLF